MCSGEPGADEFGGEQAPEVMRGEPHRLAVSVRPAPGRGGVEQGADGEDGDDLVTGADVAANRWRQGCPWVLS